MNALPRAVVALLALLFITPTWGQTPAVDDILTALRGGGYVIVVRHGATNSDQADTDPLNPQRQRPRAGEGGRRGLQGGRCADR